jgi:hypothetical protein
MVFQIQLMNTQQAVPVTRDYIAVREAQLKVNEGRRFAKRWLRQNDGSPTITLARKQPRVGRSRSGRLKRWTGGCFC